MQRILASLFHQDTPRPDAVSLADVTKFIPDPERAAEALWDLHHIVKLGLAKTYIPACADFWNVWLEGPLCPARTPGGERMTLETWCRLWQAREDWLNEWQDVLASDGKEAAL